MRNKQANHTLGKKSINPPKSTIKGLKAVTSKVLDLETVNTESLKQFSIEVRVVLIFYLYILYLNKEGRPKCQFLQPDILKILKQSNSRMTAKQSGKENFKPLYATLSV